MFDISISDDDMNGIKIFTNAEWIKEEYSNSYFEFVEQDNESDISIVDLDDICTDNVAIKINIDKYDSNIDAFISKQHIRAYLELLRKFDPEVYGIGMADITDVIMATKGVLKEYVTFKLSSDNILENIEEFKKRLRGGNLKGSAIIFLSITDLLILDRCVKDIVELYKNLDIVMLLPNKKEEEKKEKYLELFIFETK